MPERLGLRLTGRLALLAASMRAGGARVGVDALLAAHRALAAADPADRSQAYFALRPALCTRHDDFLAFEAAFAEWFGPHETAPSTDALDAGPATSSAVDLLREKDFADYTESDRLVATSVLRRLAAQGPPRPRRRSTAPRRGDPAPEARTDLRRTLRAPLRHEGAPLQRHWREPSERPRPLVLVCDASGSMEPYARMLLAYVQGWTRSRRRADAYVLGGTLTRVTAELRGPEPERGLELATAAGATRQGAARIGDALAQLNGAGAGRDAIVVVLSDGWDGGDPVLLEHELVRLRRGAHRLVWLNPAKAQPGYEPLARGMRIALPHVDRFLAGNSLQSIEGLAFLAEGGFE